jgi:hypothetical protein
MTLGRYPDSISQASVFTWQDNAEYDHGINPKVALIDLAGPNQLGHIIEVHQATPGIGPLWYRVADVHSDATVTWLFGDQYDVGVNPAIAIVGNPLFAVEVHQAAEGVGPLLYRTGQFQVHSAGVKIGLAWSASHQYDYGAHPAIVVLNDLIIEVHQAETGVGGLWCRTGKINDDGSINWASSSAYYDTGLNPAVSLDSVGGVVEVHQARANAGPLWYNHGIKNADGSISWVNLGQYDHGLNPAIGYDGLEIVEVHQAQLGVGPLWYNRGKQNADGTVVWRNLGQYDRGVNPALAASLLGNWRHMVAEVHQARPAVGPLWNHNARAPAR